MRVRRSPSVASSFRSASVIFLSRMPSTSTDTIGWPGFDSSRRTNAPNWSSLAMTRASSAWVVPHTVTRTASAQALRCVLMSGLLQELTPLHLCSSAELLRLDDLPIRFLVFVQFEAFRLFRHFLPSRRAFFQRLFLPFNRFGEVAKL